MKNNKASFSANVNKLVCAGFGVAFFIIYIASAVLLFVSEPELEVYYIKAIAMFFLYLLMYAVCVWYTTLRIQKMFAPLDQISQALLEDKIQIYGDDDVIMEFVKNLKGQMEKLQSLSDELETTKGSLEEFYEESRLNLKEYDLSLDKCKAEAGILAKKGEKFLQMSHERKAKIDVLMEQGKNIKQNQNNLHEEELALEKILKEIRISTEDTEEDFANTGDAYQLLENMLKETTELIESLFSEITVIQGIASQTNLFAVNASLEIAREGQITMGNLGMLEDIKDLTGKILGKTDEISLLVIRTKNATKLAMEQADFCKERQEEGAGNFQLTGKKLDSLYPKMQAAIDAVKEIRNVVSEITGNIYELDLITENEKEELKVWLENAKNLNKRLNMVQETMKNG